MSSLAETLLWIAAFALSVSAHESAHALTAYLLGDPTGKFEGRISLNPLRHIDPLGLLFLIIAHFGWAKPVPINPRNFTHPRFHSALTAAAGPISNFLLAFLSLNLLKALPGAPTALLFFLLIFFQLNILLALFNLIPLFPLDGEKILAVLIPRSLRGAYQQFAHYGPLILFGAIGASFVFDIDVFSFLLIAASYVATGMELLTFF